MKVQVNKLRRGRDQYAPLRKVHSVKRHADSSYVHYIVIHSTGTKSDMLLSDLDKLRYHYVVTKAGLLLNLKPVKSQDGTIEIALLGGLDIEGNRVDCRTPRQNETLFNTLVRLTEKHRKAKIVAADKLYLYGAPNPGFNVLDWIAGYTPKFLQAA
jgi:hypothetical protein